ncbi:MAG: DUF305 domain-containing protein [Flavobacteriales bacterium]|jgi:uncharacterized protein (DUF305 family)|nr:DUF305 domain-containing protein [Flavobacteriales bacterium]MBP9159503.1 DUF305 domain-containing protein [Flavobacteriales bacterium]MCI1751452.1 DUF305 domain-containing protein [Flavobacteriales bacterium]
MKTNPYTKLLALLCVSFVIMYAAMFLNVADSAHIHLSLTRAYMAVTMVSPMAVLMLLGMPSMYPDKRRNRIAGALAVIAFSCSLFALRAQVAISDVQYMRAMIPHHSSAIMTSSNASLKDPEVRALADSIVVAQKREIAQMEAMLARISAAD